MHESVNVYAWVFNIISKISTKSRSILYFTQIIAHRVNVFRFLLSKTKNDNILEPENPRNTKMNTSSFSIGFCMSKTSVTVYSWVGNGLFLLMGIGFCMSKTQCISLSMSLVSVYAWVWYLWYCLCLSLSSLYYTPASKKRGYTVLALSVLPSLRPSETNTFIILFSATTNSWLLILQVGVPNREMRIQICRPLLPVYCQSETKSFVTLFSATTNARLLIFGSKFRSAAPLLPDNRLILSISEYLTILVKGYKFHHTFSQQLQKLGSWCLACSFKQWSHTGVCEFRSASSVLPVYRLKWQKALFWDSGGILSEQ